MPSQPAPPAGSNRGYSSKANPAAYHTRPVPSKPAAMSTEEMKEKERKAAIALSRAKTTGYTRTATNINTYPQSEPGYYPQSDPGYYSPSASELLHSSSALAIGTRPWPPPPTPGPGQMFFPPSAAALPEGMSRKLSIASTLTELTDSDVESRRGSLASVAEEPSAPGYTAVGSRSGYPATSRKPSPAPGYSASRKASFASGYSDASTARKGSTASGSSYRPTMSEMYCSEEDEEYDGGCETTPKKAMGKDRRLAEAPGKGRNVRARGGR